MDLKNYSKDRRVVLTLDAGGTNMVFGAMQASKMIAGPVTLPANSDNLDKCLSTLVEGFQKVKSILKDAGSPDPVAISFAFPGPADYPNGIIGGYLPNFPSFRDGVALGPFLKKAFGIPVYINNDGDLYAYGEALGGALVDVNQRLGSLGSTKTYHNLIGYTLGTGCGIGTVIGERLNRGDNSCVETFCLKHPTLSGIILEDGASIRAVKRVYAELSGSDDKTLEPKDISEIAFGKRPGDKTAALKAFESLGEVVGEAIACSATIIDGLVVIGGGLMKSSSLIMPSILKVLRSEIGTLSGDKLSRMQMKVYNLDDEQEFKAFAKGDARTIKVYGSDDEVIYDPQKRIGVMTSKIGASQAISLGAYMFALTELDK